MIDSENPKSLLWARFKKGDRKAFEKIYREYATDLMYYGFKITDNRELVEDCIHDLFVELWKSREDLSDVDTPKFYLFKSLRYKLYRMLTKESFVSPSEMRINLSPQTTEYLELKFINKENHKIQSARFQRLLEQLPVRQREILYLRFYLDLPYKKISLIMEMNYQSVLNLLQRAIKTLRDKYSSDTIYNRDINLS